MTDKELDLIVENIINRLKYRFKYLDYAAVLNLDADSGFEYVIGPITGNCIINLLNAKDGDTGIIKVVIDSTGGHTISLGAEFNKRLTDAISTSASEENILFWTKIASDIVYSISQVQ